MKHCPAIIHELSKDHIKYERLDDYINHEVDGVRYFSNKKRLKDKNYDGEIAENLNYTSGFIDTNIQPFNDEYDREITTFTITLSQSIKIKK